MANRADADCAVAMGIRRREYRGPPAAGAYDTCPEAPLPDKAVHHAWLLHGWTSSSRVAMAGAEGPTGARRRAAPLVRAPLGAVAAGAVAAGGAAAGVRQHGIGIRCNTTWWIDSAVVVRSLKWTTTDGGVGLPPAARECGNVHGYPP